MRAAVDYAFSTGFVRVAIIALCREFMGGHRNKRSSEEGLSAPPSI